MGRCASALIRIRPCCPRCSARGPEAAAQWGVALVERCAGRAAVVKPQAGLFERWGSKGLAALEQVCEAARKADLLVILDAKRGDIGSTAEGYAEGYLGEASTCPCDAITVNPYMGIDTIEPFVAVAERQGKGVVVLARTSNPGSKDFQAKLVDGEPLYLHVARALQPLIARLRGESGWSGLMMVAGATARRMPGACARRRAKRCSWFPAMARRARARAMRSPASSSRAATRWKAASSTPRVQSPHPQAPGSASAARLGTRDRPALAAAQAELLDAAHGLTIGYVG